MRKRILQDVVPAPKKRSTKPVIKVASPEPAREMYEREELQPREERLLRQSQSRDTREPRAARIVAPARPEREVFPYVSKDEREVEDKRLRPRRSYKNLFIWSAVVASVIILVFGLSLMYESATVKITPKIQSVTVDSVITAKKDAPLAGEVRYEVMTITREGSETVPSIPGPKVETKAKGTLTFYNTTPLAQKLPTQTIITNPKGLRYKLNAAITIPAAKTVKGTVTPGTIAAGITAELAGDKYNMLQSDAPDADFKINSFKSSTKYSAVYGRMKTNISGGASGITQVVNPQLESATRLKINNDLKNQVLLSAKSQTPEGYVLFDNADVITYESLPTTPGLPAGEPTAVINQKLTFYGIIFKRSDIIDTVAGKELVKFNNGQINSDSLTDLNFTVINSKTFKPQTGTPLVFSLKGLFKMVGTYPEKMLRESLAGKHVKDISTLLSQYGTIATADVILRPFWKQSFPNDPDKITIETK